MQRSSSLLSGAFYPAILPEQILEIRLESLHQLFQQLLSAGNKRYILGLEHLGSGAQMAVSNPPISAVRLVHF